MVSASAFQVDDPSSSLGTYTKTKTFLNNKTFNRTTTTIGHFVLLLEYNKTSVLHFVEWLAVLWQLINFRKAFDYGAY